MKSSYSVVMNNDDKVTIPLQLLTELIEVASWYQSVCNGARVGETYTNHPDKNAFDYLQSEGQAIHDRACRFLPNDHPYRDALYSNSDGQSVTELDPCDCGAGDKVLWMHSIYCAKVVSSIGKPAQPKDGE